MKITRAIGLRGRRARAGRGHPRPARPADRNIRPTPAPMLSARRTSASIPERRRRAQHHPPPTRPRTSTRRRWRKPFAVTSRRRSSWPFRPTRISSWPRSRAVAATSPAAASVHVRTAQAALRQDGREQPELGGEILGDGGMVVHVVAAKVGEAGCRQAQSVEASLVQSVAGGLERSVGHAFAGQPVEHAVEGYRVGRGQAAIGSPAPETIPMVPTLAASYPAAAKIWRVKGRDGGLAARAGNRDQTFRLAWMNRAAIRASSRRHRRP